MKKCLVLIVALFLNSFLLVDVQASLKDVLDLEGKILLRKLYEAEENQKNRYRNQFKIIASILPELAQGWKLGFGLATSSGAPGSGFQTMGNAFSKKTIYLNLAYLRKEFGFWPGSYFEIGKHKLHFFRPMGSQMLWDSDITPEGTTFGYHSSEGSLKPWFSMGSYWIEEREFTGDSMLHAVQVGVKHDRFNLGAGLFYYTNLGGFNTLYSATNSYGNLTTTSGSTLTYQSEFRLLNFGAEFHFPFFLKEIHLFLDTVYNFAANGNRSGYSIGFQWGKIKKLGDWFIRLQYRYLQANATLGVLSGSDFSNYRTGTNGFQLVVKGRIVGKFDLKANYIDYMYTINGDIRNQIFQLDGSYPF